MSRQSMIESDINSFLGSLQGLDNNARKDLLKNLIQKHIILTESDLVIDYYDTINMMGRASSIYAQMPVPVTISGKRLDATQLSSYAMLQSVVEFLNSKGAIKRLPVFK